MTTIEELGRRAKQASRHMNRMGTTQKNQILALAAQALVDEQEEILKANAMDIEAARKKNMPTHYSIRHGSRTVYLKFLNSRLSAAAK